jgi:LppP/LprE lipoprotein
MSQRMIVAIAAAAGLIAGGAAAMVIVVGGSGGDSPSTVATPPLTTASQAAVRTRTVTVTTTAAPPPGPPSLDEALAEVAGQGFTVPDSSTYRSSESVAVLTGMKPEGDGTRQQAFFFADGRYLGTDTKDTSAGIDFAYQTGDTIALNYALYSSSDPQCCPSDGSATVRYRWTGQQLVPLDPIPPTSYDVDGSRR